ncbi:hypothetical protein GCM10022417_12670 [Corynebacterium pilbarense]
MQAGVLDVRYSTSAEQEASSWLCVLARDLCDPQLAGRASPGGIAPGAEFVGVGQ